MYELNANKTVTYFYVSVLSCVDANVRRIRSALVPPRLETGESRRHNHNNNNLDKLFVPSFNTIFRYKELPSFRSLHSLDIELPE
jgi:hypothetical protein